MSTNHSKYRWASSQPAIERARYFKFVGRRGAYRQQLLQPLQPHPTDDTELEGRGRKEYAPETKRQKYVRVQSNSRINKVLCDNKDKLLKKRKTKINKNWDYVEKYITHMKKNCVSQFYKRFSAARYVWKSHFSRPCPSIIGYGGSTIKHRKMMIILFHIMS